MKRAWRVFFLICFLMITSYGLSEPANMLFNGSFDQTIFIAGLNIEPPAPDGSIDTKQNWVFFTNSGGEGKAYVQDGVLVVEITNGGNHTWSVQILQSPISVEKFHRYKVSFTAKASSKRKIGVKIGGTAGRGWVAYNPGTDESGGIVFELGTDWKTYEFEFVMRQESDTNARFEFQLGKAVGVVWIDNVFMEMIGVVERKEKQKIYTEEDEDKVEDWQLVWSQEFDDETIDTSLWNFEIGNGHAKGIPGWGNAELQYYTDRNAFIEQGCLVIEARKERASDEYGTYDYTSARMTTEGKFEIKYGRIEIRAKLPKGKGIWPALWMLGSNIGQVGWPRCGEIDIMEMLGHDTRTVYGTVHGPGYSGGASIGVAYKLPESVADFSEDFHVFAIEWDEDEIEWYVDDQLYHVLSKDEIEELGLEWVFDQPFFLIMNVAVGGYWPGYPDETTVFPQRMYIDYIRVFEDKNPEKVVGEVNDCEYELIIKKAGPKVTFEEINNGSFDEPIVNDQANQPDEWFIWQAGTYGISGAKVSNYGTKDGYAYINLANTGTETWHIQFNQWIGLYRGKTYLISFKAKSDTPRTINVKILQNHDPWINYFVQTVNLTKEWQTFTFTYTHPETADEIVQISFELGTGPVTTVYFDDISISSK
ncbi:Glucan endo-1,3-beta-D-glucosidase [Pseudothermotoga thermarum DSM 5069]|uniref:Glucan endo-1,3-beta-D-glucosidase n=2 Tax=Pseudothermotoga thermarum TaxID=119394 RepID=F7YXE5_9THEM|nr:carbohydrate binding domain-containing protein [Pseudothermotoga thermarum]AEH51752.1 Glucan endo-1,3-beta-D-glucosidase [Pseudothermotoga thermarum DSM 5069]